MKWGAGPPRGASYGMGGIHGGAGRRKVQKTRSLTSAHFLASRQRDLGDHEISDRTVSRTPDTSSRDKGMQTTRADDWADNLSASWWKDTYPQEAADYDEERFSLL